MLNLLHVIKFIYDNWSNILLLLVAILTVYNFARRLYLKRQWGAVDERAHPSNFAYYNYEFCSTAKPAVIWEALEEKFFDVDEHLSFRQAPVVDLIDTDKPLSPANARKITFFFRSAISEIEYSNENKIWQLNFSCLQLSKLTGKLKNEQELRIFITAIEDVFHQIDPKTKIRAYIDTNTDSDDPERQSIILLDQLRPTYQQAHFQSTNAIMRAPMSAFNSIINFLKERIILVSFLALIALIGIDRIVETFPAIVKPFIYLATMPNMLNISTGWTIGFLIVVIVIFIIIRALFKSWFGDAIDWVKVKIYQFLIRLAQDLNHIIGHEKRDGFFPLSQIISPVPPRHFNIFSMAIRQKKYRQKIWRKLFTTRNFLSRFSVFIIIIGLIATGITLLITTAPSYGSTPDEPLTRFERYWNQGQDRDWGVQMFLFSSVFMSEEDYFGHLDDGLGFTGMLRETGLSDLADILNGKSSNLSLNYSMTLLFPESILQYTPIMAHKDRNGTERQMFYGRLSFSNITLQPDGDNFYDISYDVSLTRGDNTYTGHHSTRAIYIHNRWYLYLTDAGESLRDQCKAYRTANFQSLDYCNHPIYDKVDTDKIEFIEIDGKKYYRINDEYIIDDDGHTFYYPREQ